MTGRWLYSNLNSRDCIPYVLFITTFSSFHFFIPLLHSAPYISFAYFFEYRHISVVSILPTQIESRAIINSVSALIGSDNECSSCLQCSDPKPLAAIANHTYLLCRIVHHTPNLGQENPLISVTRTRSNFIEYSSWVFPMGSLA